jgi:hypothetical protein
VQYRDASAGVDRSTITSDDLLVTGPAGFSRTAQLVKVKSARGGVVRATYRLINPTGKFTPAQGGTYQILLQPNEVKDEQGEASATGVLGTFAVTTGGAGSRIGVKAPRHRNGDPDHEDD